MDRGGRKALAPEIFLSFCCFSFHLFLRFFFLFLPDMEIVLPSIDSGPCGINLATSGTRGRHMHMHVHMQPLRLASTLNRYGRPHNSGRNVDCSVDEVSLPYPFFSFPTIQCATQNMRHSLRLSTPLPLASSGPAEESHVVYPHKKEKRRKKKKSYSFRAKDRLISCSVEQTL